MCELEDLEQVRVQEDLAVVAQFDPLDGGIAFDERSEVGELEVARSDHGSGCAGGAGAGGAP
jgi:hypothetical protein